MQTFEDPAICKAMAGVAWIRVCANGSMKRNNTVQAVCVICQHWNTPTLGTYAVYFRGRGEWDSKEKAAATQKSPSLSN